MPGAIPTVDDMDLGGGQIDKGDEEKSPPESPGGYHLRRRHLHHLMNNNLSPKSIIWIMLLVIFVDLSCLLLYQSIYNNNYQFLAKSQESKHSFLPQEDFSFRQANIFSPSDDEPNSERKFSSPSFEPRHRIRQGYTPSSPADSVPRNLSSPADSVPRNLSSPADSVHGNLSFPADSVQRNLSSPVNQEKEETKLENILSKAAMVTKTIIITTVNAAWTTPNSIFDLFLEGFRIGNQTQALLNHTLVVALDQKAYSHCLELHPHCFALSTEGVDFSGKVSFMSEDYLKMMWRRIEFLQTVLEMGYSFIFTDADILWFRNPFHQFYSDADFQIACDHFQFNSTDTNNLPNGGFVYVRSNNITIQFYKFWYKSKETYPWTHDQDVLNKIKFDPYISKIGLKIKFLDTAYFGGFCEPSKDLNVVCTMHANCCTSLDSKIHDLQMMIDDWKKYMTMPGNHTIPQPWTMPRYCG